MVTRTLEPKDKLGAMTTISGGAAAAAPVDVAVVNGPEGELSDWNAIDWRASEQQVRRLRQRIFTASQAGDLKRVRNLQKLMLRSRANTLISVRRVTELNAGRLTAGVDGEVVLDPQAKLELATWVQHSSEPWAGPSRQAGVYPQEQRKAATPEEPGNAASETGVFHATLIDGHACASIGGGPTRWPQGWSVRFNPTELVDAAGHLVAREGDELTAGGGFGLRATASSPCGPVGALIWSVAIRVTKA
jgi:hypothetical protein